MDLSDTEICIMNIIWKKEKATSFDIIKDTKGKIAENSIRTLLARMVKKKAIQVIAKDGNTYIYSSLINKKEFQKSKLKDFFELIYEQNKLLLQWDILHLL